MDAIARIKELMEERGWTLYRLSQESGIAITTLINLLHHSKQPALQTIEIICESMEITLAEFFTRPSEPGGFTAEQLKLFALWDSLTEEQRSAVLELLLALQAKRNEEKSRSFYEKGEQYYGCKQTNPGADGAA